MPGAPGPPVADCSGNELAPAAYITAAMTAPGMKTIFSGLLALILAAGPVVAQNIAVAPAPSRDGPVLEERDTAVLQGLDKITARVRTFDAH